VKIKRLRQVCLEPVPRQTGKGLRREERRPDLRGTSSKQILV